MPPPVERAAVLMALMRQLEGVMRAENALLREMRLDRLHALQEEKTALADAYEAELRRLRAEPDAVAALDPAARADLEEAMRGFRAEAQANRRRLEVARGVVEGVARALGGSLSGSSPYGSGTAPSPVGRVVPLSLNRRV